MWPTKVKIIMAIVRPILWLIGPMVISGDCSLPETAGVIIVAPHRSEWDVFILQLVISRQIHFIAKKELFSWWWSGWFVRLFEAFPVAQNTADRKALRTAISYLKAGRVVGIFPEGKIQVDRAVGQLQPGIALIATQSQAPILAVAICGSARPWYLRRRITIRFSELIPAPRNKAEQATWLAKIQAFFNTDTTRAG